MSKKLLVAAAAVVISSGAMAQSAFEGFYGQLGVGYENDSFANKSIYVTGASGDGGNALSAPSQSAGNFSGAIGLGYNYSLAPRLLLGLGVDYNPLSRKSNQTLICNGCSANSTMQASNRFSVFVTPGYEIDKDKLAYFKAGYTQEQVQLTIPVQGTNAFTSQVQSNANAGGYVLGLGYKQLVDKNIYVFGEANYNTYSAVTVSASGANSGGGTGTGAVKTTPSAYQFLIGAGYKF